MNRRAFVTHAGALTLSASLTPLEAAAGIGAEPYSRLLPDMLAAYQVGILNRLASDWNKKRARIKTAAALEARNKFVRATVIEMIGGFPQRNPLGARVVKVMERPGYRVENVMFQSRPDFWVTGNLYIPSTASGPMPAIISPCGHYPLARMLPQYQLAYQSLVKAGFVVLAYDPIGQGERRQYWNPATGITEVGSPTYEHSMPGQLHFLFGESLTGYLVWDAMRAIDYLLTRPEVDPKRIGCTGHSGGGTLTKFTVAVDERIQCAVIHEGGTANRWPITLSPANPLGPSDVEQNLFPAAIHGIDSADLHIAIAPRPLMATIEHFSSSFDASAASVRERYALLGAKDKFSVIAADDPHAWTYKLRLATVDWFSRWFLHRSGPASEPELTPERPRDLQCTPDGSIRYSSAGETVWTTIRSKGGSSPPSRILPASVTDADAFRESMKADITKLLRLRKLDNPLAPRATGEVQREGYVIEKLAFLSEPSIYIPTWVFQPKNRRPGTPAILYFNEAGKDSDGMEFESSEASGLKYGVLATLAKRGYQVIAADVRGVGETRTPHRSASGGNEFQHLFDAETALSYMAWYADSSLFGMRVQDVMRTVDYAVSRVGAGQSVWVIGKDMGALLALYAAALDSRIQSVVCHRGLVSYRALTAVDRYLHGANVIVPRALEQFDLPHVVAAVAGRRVALMSPVDAMKRPVDVDQASKTYDWAKSVFGIAGSPDKLRLVSHNPDEDLAARYLQLLGGDSAV